MGSDHFVYLRGSGRRVKEKILSSQIQNFLFHHSVGRLLVRFSWGQIIIAKCYGWIQNQSFSARKIPAFIKDFQIKEDEFEVKEFDSFNDFFTRRFKSGQRKFPSSSFDLGSPGEGRILVMESLDRLLPIKNQDWSLERLLGCEEAALKMKKASALVLRMAPSDYHRFHSFDQLEVREARKISGGLHTVHPHARKDSVFFENRRVVFDLKTENFGDVCLVAVGGFCVGEIVLHPKKQFLKGEEMGYFQMGGSTILLFFSKRFEFHADLLKASKEGFETLISLGEALGRSSEG